MNSVSKKLTVVLILALMFFSSDSILAEFNLGLKTGLNISKLAGDVKPQYDIKGASKMTFAVGIFESLEYTDYFHIQLELLLVRKGAKSDEGDPFQGRVNLIYAEIPVLFKLNPLPKKKYSPALFAGAAADLLHSAKLIPDSPYKDVEIDDWVKKLDYCIVFGIGVDTDLGLGTLMVDGRYSIGMTNINDTDYDWDIKNRVFSVFVGFLF